MRSIAPDWWHDLRHRSAAAERMETDCAGYEDYRNCLADLARVNSATLTHQPVLRWLARETKDLKSFSLLDVGCGYGDLLRRIAGWSRRRGVEAQLLGLDRHEWSIRAAREASSADPGIRYIEADLFAFKPDVPFDFIVSSQFAHHLSDDLVMAFMRWQEAHARRGWMIADLQRHRISHLGFPVLGAAARWHHFVRSDGRISIARGFRMAELRSLAARAGLAGDTVEIAWHAPFRLTLARRCVPRSL